MEFDNDLGTDEPTSKNAISGDEPSHTLSEKSLHEESKFDIDRLIFDRSVWVCYYPSVVKLSDRQHYDPELIDRCDLEFDIKQTAYKGKAQETVWVREWGDPAWLTVETRLRQSRSLIAYFNFNRYFFQTLHMKHDMRLPVIHDDNFLPMDANVTIEDYLRVFQETLPKSIIDIYTKNFSKFWPTQFAWLQDHGETPICKCVTLEVGRELAPMVVTDIRTDLCLRGISHTSYNKTESTIYFGEKPKTEVDYRVDNTTLGANVTTWNVKDPYESIKQGKLYQKSVKLARFEITLYDGQIEFNSLHPVEDVQFTMDRYAELFGLTMKSEKKTHQEMINFVSILYKQDEGLIDKLLKHGATWYGTQTNKLTTRKLLRRGLILKSGKKNGQYITNPALLKMFEGYVKPKEQKEYWPKFL